MMTIIIKLTILELWRLKRLLFYFALLGEELVDLSRPEWKKLWLNSKVKALKSSSVMVTIMRKSTKVCSKTLVSYLSITPKWTDSKLNLNSVIGLGWSFLTMMDLITTWLERLFSKNFLHKVLNGLDYDLIKA